VTDETETAGETVLDLAGVRAATAAARRKPGPRPHPEPEGGRDRRGPVGPGPHRPASGLIARTDGITAQDQRQAAERGIAPAAQRRLRIRLEADRRKRKAALVPTLITWTNRQLVEVHDRIVDAGQPAAVAIAQRALSIAGHWLELAWSFGAAHWLGWVGIELGDRRAVQCQVCPFVELEDDRAYCGVVPGCRGRCPRAAWWPFAQLGYRRRLTAFECPVGAFPRGPLGRGLLQLVTFAGLIAAGIWWIWGLLG
jgi:hypothetical protein